MTLFPPLIRTKAPGHRIRGDGARNRGFVPSFIGRCEGRRGTGPSGALASSHNPIREIRKSRSAHRRFAGPSFRTLIADDEGSIPLFKEPDRRACGFVEIG